MSTRMFLKSLCSKKERVWSLKIKKHKVPLMYQPNYKSRSSTIRCCLNINYGQAFGEGRTVDLSNCLIGLGHPSKRIVLVLV